MHVSSGRTLTEYEISTVSRSPKMEVAIANHLGFSMSQESLPVESLISDIRMKGPSRKGVHLHAEYKRVLRDIVPL